MTPDFRKLAAPLVSRAKTEYLGLIIVSATWLAFFARVISGRSVYWLDDLKIIYYPMEIAYAQAQAAMQLPVWSNLFGFGQPLIGWGQLGFFTPLHFALRLLLDPLTLLQVSVVSYFLFGVIGFYIFLRRQQLTPLISSFGAVTYAFSGFNIGHLNHVNFYVSTMVLPWLLVAVHYFLQKPTLKRTGLIAVAIAIMMLSGQPQVGAYSVAVAAIYGVASLLSGGAARLLNYRWVIKAVSLVVLAAVLTLLLSSFAIFPLLEFLPLTERADGLPRTVLYEFSYPPSHAITLIAPYFFGDHDNYWGAKGFQELAAFTGIIPLLLAGYALGNWRKRLALRVTGILLLVLGIVIALGKHSPLYTYLVENDIITSLTIPGRFVFFTVTGLVFLAIAGLDDLVRITTIKKHWPRLLSAIGLPILFLASFAATFYSMPRWLNQAQYYLTTGHPSLVMFVAGAIAFSASIILKKQMPRELILTVFTALALLTFAWDYNPLTDREALVVRSPLADSVVAPEGNIPARLYSRPLLLSSRNTRDLVATREVGRDLQVWQPVPVFVTNPCYGLPLSRQSNVDGAVHIGLHESLLEAPLSTTSIRAQTVRAGEHPPVCFTNVTPREEPYFLSITSAEPSGMTLSVQGTPGELSMYLVRARHPTSEQVLASQKELRLDLKIHDQPFADQESYLMARHLHVAAGMSSARWIGALTTRPYREFIEFFFANDREPVDGDDTHVITQHRELFDFSGVTHLAQLIPMGATDTMSAGEFNLEAESVAHTTTFRLYSNPAAYPKAFVVANAIYVPAADDIRAALSDPTFRLDRTMYITGPVPPPDAQLTSQQGSSKVTVVKYTDTEVIVSVNTTQPGWLVVNDTNAPQWQVTVDGEPQPYYVANTLFKTVFVPGGSHEVRWVYDSPAITQATRATLVGLALLLLLQLPYHLVGKVKLKKKR